MPNLRPGKLCNPEFLRELRPDLLRGWLWPLRDYFLRRGLPVAPPEADVRVDCDHLARILMDPVADMPEALLESLYLFRELDNAPAMDAIYDATHRCGIDLGLGPEATPLDVVVRAWALDRRLVEARSGPFLLLTPTRHGFTPVVDAVLHRAPSAALALMTILDPAELVRPALPPSAFGPQPSALLLAPFLDAWASCAANWRQSGQTLQHIHREIAAVRQDFTELRTAKQQLEKMLADGLFLFTQKVDATSFKVLCAILAEGDAAKAGRRLGFSDALVRYYLRQWAGRGVAYKTMLDLVRWRKQVGRKQTVPLNDAILHAYAGATDYPGLLSDVLDGLLSMTADNWPDLCAELADLLRPAIAAANQPNAARPTPIRQSL